MMMLVFEVHLAPGAGRTDLLSKEILRETQAQVMTPDEAKKVGFGGLPDTPADHELRFIAVAQRDAQWIQRSLEADDAVAGFKIHQIG
jgi:hypothetical protein